MTDFAIQYMIVVAMWNLASLFRRSLRDSLYFVTLVTLVVFQTISIYRFHYLYEGLDTT